VNFTLSLARTKAAEQIALASSPQNRRAKLGSYNTIAATEKIVGAELRSAMRRFK